MKGQHQLWLCNEALNVMSNHTPTKKRKGMPIKINIKMKTFLILTRDRRDGRLARDALHPALLLALTCVERLVCLGSLGRRGGGGLPLDLGVALFAQVFKGPRSGDVVRVYVCVHHILEVQPQLLAQGEVSLGARVYWVDYNGFAGLR